MGTEIEAKLKVDSLEKVAEKLTGSGAEFLQEQVQKDFYFDDANADLTKTDRCLRLRQQFADGEEKILLTYKGAKEKDNFKKRREIEIEIGDAASLRELLSALGYEERLTVEKTRRLWRLNKCEVALDSLPMLGDFVEIEGPDDKAISEVQNSLGLSDLQHIVGSYAALTKAKLHEPSRQ